MESSIGTLSVLAEVTTGFVAFAVIVATLRVAFGQKLTQFQMLLVQFFSVNGMLILSVALLPLVLAEFWQDETTVALYTIYYTLFVATTYPAYYIWQRIRIRAPTPIASLFVMIGYAIWLLVLASVAMGILWQPSLAIVISICYWGLFSSAIIFVQFLAEFIYPR
jgi:hypothetical protein